MATFRLVTPLLRELDRRGQIEFEAGWDQAVIGAIEDLEGRYKQLRDRNRKLIDYASLPVQMAYAFKYVASHADFLAQVLDYAVRADAGGALTDRELRVTSLGGGPGSDLLAIIKAVRSLAAEHRPRAIRYRVLDKQPNWNEALTILADSQRASLDIQLEFERIDVTIEAD